MARESKSRLFSRFIRLVNDDLTIKTEGLSAEVQTSVTSALDSAGVVNLITANSSGGGVTATTLTKTFTQNEEYQLTLTDSIAISPIVSATKEVAPSDISSKGNWDVASNGANYDLHNTAFDTTLRFGTLTYDMSVSLANTVIYPYTDFTASTGIVGIEFNYNGTKLYVMQGYYVHQYTLSTAYDISTATDDGVPFNMVTGATADSSPRSFKFKPDGTRFYMTGDRFDRVYQFDLSTAWDMSTASYGTDQFLSLGRQKYFVEFNDDGTQMYGYDYLYGTVKRYNLSTAWDVTTGVLEDGNVFTFAHNQTVNDPNAHYSTTGMQAREMRFNESGTKLLVMAGTGNTRNSSNRYLDFWNGFFHEYSLSTPYDISTATYVRKSFDPKQDNGVNQYSPTPVDEISSFVYNGDGDKIYAVMTGYVNEILEFQLSNVKEVGLLGSGSFDSADIGKRIIAGGGEAVVTSAFGEYSEVVTIPDVTYQSGQWQMYGLDVNATSGIHPSFMQTGGHLDDYIQLVATKATSYTTAGLAISEDGTKIFQVTGNLIHYYSLLTPYYIGTSSFVESFDFTTDIASIGGITFLSNGTKCYISGGGNCAQYNLSTAYDLNTASLVNIKSGGVPTSLAFNPQGTIVFGASYGNASVFQYTLSTPYDITTISSSVGSFNTGSTSLRAMTLSPDGYRLFVTNGGNSTVKQYDMSTAYDISTAVDNTISISVGRVAGICLDAIGKFMYTGAYNNLNIIQHELGLQLFNQFTGYSTAITNSTGQISVANWTDINSMTADHTISDSNEIYYAVSTDGKRSFNIANSTLGERIIARMKDSGDSAWQYNWNPTYGLNSWTDASSNDMFTALNEAIATNETNRMDSAQLANIQDAYHFAIDSSDTINLAIIMKSAGTSIPYSDGVSINYTGALYEKGAKFDSDYTYTHDDDKHITITALRAGNYKFRVI